MKKLAIVALSLATAFSSAAPAQAYPLAAPKKAGISDIETVQHYHRRYYRHRHWHDDDGDRVGAIIGGGVRPSFPPSIRRPCWSITAERCRDNHGFWLRLDISVSLILSFQYKVA